MARLSLHFEGLKDTFAEPLRRQILDQKMQSKIIIGPHGINLGLLCNYFKAATERHIFFQPLDCISDITLLIYCLFFLSFILRRCTNKIFFLLNVVHYNVSPLLPCLRAATVTVQ